MSDSREAFGIWIEKEFNLLGALSLSAHDFDLMRKAWQYQQSRIDALTVELKNNKPLEWTSGLPKGYVAEEWFLAKLDSGRVVALKSLPEDWSYDYTTADETYYKAYRIKQWMQLPNSQYITPSERYENQIKELTAKHNALEQENAALIDIVAECRDIFSESENIGNAMGSPADVPEFIADEVKALRAQLADKVPESWTNLLAYVLQDDVHNRLTPRVVDIAYSAFMGAKQPNKEDGGASDWFTDTKPMITEAIAKLRNDLIEERGDAQLGQGFVVMENPIEVKNCIFGAQQSKSVKKIDGGDLLRIASKNSILADFCDLQTFAADLLALESAPQTKPVDERELPPIPEPTRLLYSLTNGHVYGFTVAQMQDYARAALGDTHAE